MTYGDSWGKNQNFKYIIKPETPKCEKNILILLQKLREKKSNLKIEHEANKVMTAITHRLIHVVYLSW